MMSYQNEKTVSIPHNQMTPFLPSTPVLDILHLLGVAGKLIGDILAYKKAIKALEVEQEHIREQARVMHHQIDARLTVELKKLAQQQETFTILNTQYMTQLDEYSLNNASLRKALDQAMHRLCHDHLKETEQTELISLVRCLSTALTDNTKEGSKAFHQFCQTIEKQLLQNPATRHALLQAPHPHI